MDEEKKNPPMPPAPEKTEKQEKPQAAPAPGSEAQAQGTTQAPVKKSVRDRIKEHYNGENPQTEEDWEVLGHKYMDEAEKGRKKYDDVSNGVKEVFAANPEMAHIYDDMRTNNVSFRAALARCLDVSELVPKEGDEDYEAYTKAAADRMAQAEKFKETKAAIDKNEIESGKALDDYCTKKGYDDQTKGALLEQLNNDLNNLLLKKITPEMLERADKAMNYDGAMADAAKAAEVRGRNASIEEKRMAEVPEVKGDGIPAPAGDSGAPASATQNDEDQFFKGVFTHRRFK